MSEQQIQQAIRLALQGPDIVFFRNNVGTAVQPDRSVVRYGLAVGSSDLIGCVAGRFCALEVKTPTGRVTPEQKTFIALVRSKGGFAAIVRSVEDARAAVERCRRGEVM